MEYYIWIDSLGPSLYAINSEHVFWWSADMEWEHSIINLEDFPAYKKTINKITRRITNRVCFKLQKLLDHR